MFLDCRIESFLVRSLYIKVVVVSIFETTTTFMIYLTKQSKKTIKRFPAVPPISVPNF